MKFMKVNSIFSRDTNILEDEETTRTKKPVSSTATDTVSDPPSARSSSGKFNITSYRMHALESENQYLYEQNQKLSQELKNAQSTNEALVDILKNKDRQIDTIVREQQETLLRAHAIEQSMRLMLLDDGKQHLKGTKNLNKHNSPESLQKFVTALKSIHPLSYQTELDHPDPNSLIPRRRTPSSRKQRYTKPLLPPLPTIYDSEESSNLPIEDVRS